MNGFEVMKAIADISASIRRAEAFIKGGDLTQVLVELGDTWVQSAIDHLHQAAGSKYSRDRRLQAAGDLQAAFFLYDRSAGRGPNRSLRRAFDLNDLAATHGKAAACAASISLIYWTLGESKENRRRWLDRVARHTAEHCRNVRAMFSLYLRFDKAIPTPTLPNLEAMWHALPFYLDAYFALERNILPPRLVRPLPLSHAPSDDPRVVNCPPNDLHLLFSREISGLPGLYRDELWLPTYAEQ